jgi:hypothetical protein
MPKANRHPQRKTMTKIILLSPHDPIPEPGAHGLVLRRLGEDNPVAIVTEIIFHGRDGASIAAHRPDGTAMSLDDAVALARTEAKSRDISTLYVLDRTQGQREQEVLRAHGLHNFPADVLSDTDPEDGEQGSDLRDRPHDAGFMR